MPTYGYRCTVCGHEFERVQKMSDAPITECETCGERVKKILYPVGIAFKGEGFYVNDSKSSGPKRPEAAKADGEAKSESEPKTDAPAAPTAGEPKKVTGSETKSAPAAEKKAEG